MMLLTLIFDHPNQDLNPIVFQSMLFFVRPSFEVVKEGRNFQYISDFYWITNKEFDEFIWKCLFEQVNAFKTCIVSGN